MFFSISFLFVFGFRRVIWSFDSEEILPHIWMGHFGRTFLLMNEETLFSVKDGTHVNLLLTSLFCSKYWTALICDRIQRSFRKPWLNGKNCSSCECPCDLVRVPILGNCSVFCIVTFYKTYVFCHCVVFLWRSKSRLVSSRYIVETQENH